MPGFDNTKHDKYVEKGYCHAVHWSKAYCHKLKGHEGLHEGIYLLEDGSMKLHPTWP